MVLIYLAIANIYSMDSFSCGVGPKINYGHKEILALKVLGIKKIAQMISQDVKNGKNFKKWFNKPIPEDLYEAIDDELIKYHLSTFLLKYSGQIKFSRIEINDNSIQSAPKARINGGAPRTLDLSQSNKFLAVGYSNGVRVIDVETTKEIFRCPKKTAVSCVKFSRDNKLLFVGLWNGKILLFDTAKGQRIFVFEGHKSLIAQMVISNDDTFLVSRSHFSTRVHIWNIKFFKHACSLIGHQDDIRNIAIANNDEFIATISADRTAKIWNFKGELLQTFGGHARYSDVLVITNDGKYIFTGSDKKVILWQVNSPHPIRTFEQTVNITDLAITPDDKTIFIATFNDLRVANLIQTKLVPLNKDQKSAGASPRFRKIIRLTNNASCILGITSDRYTIFDFEGNCLGNVEEPGMAAGRAPCAIISNNGKYIITDNENGSIVIWKISSILNKLVQNSFHSSGFSLV